MNTAIPLIHKLYSEYPFVPFVLLQEARVKIEMGQIEEARSLLNHAIINDPSFEEVKKIIATIP